MASESHVIKCATCNVPLEGPAEPKPDDTVRCPVCGVHDTLEKAVAVAEDYVLSQTGNALNETLEGMVRGSDFMQLTEKFPVKTGHRFIVDFEPDLQ